MENNQVISRKYIIIGLVFIDDEWATLTLTADGELLSTELGGDRKRFSMKKDVLGFVVEGQEIRVKMVVEKAEGICCGHFGGDFVRKDFVFEPLIDQNGWCYHLCRYLDSLGRPKRLLVFLMGSARIDFYALQRIICLRQYNGRLLFLPARGFESYGQPASCSLYKDSPVSNNELGYQGPETKFEDLEWREIEGPFVSVWLHNVPWGAENTLAAPGAKFSDGYLDLIVLKNWPKLVLLSLLRQLSDGTHVYSPYIAYLKVKAFVLEPGPVVDEPDREGIIDSDGEVLVRGKRTYNCDKKSLMSYEKLQITVDKGLATLFSPEK